MNNKNLSDAPKVLDKKEWPEIKRGVQDLLDELAGEVEIMWCIMDRGYDIPTMRLKFLKLQDWTRIRKNNRLVELAGTVEALEWAVGYVGGGLISDPPTDRSGHERQK